jgi:hypothetical protein
MLTGSLLPCSKMSRNRGIGVPSWSEKHAPWRSRCKGREGARGGMLLRPCLVRGPGMVLLRAWSQVHVGRCVPKF